MLLLLAPADKSRLLARSFVISPARVFKGLSFLNNKTIISEALCSLSLLVCVCVCRLLWCVCALCASPAAIGSAAAHTHIHAYSLTRRPLLLLAVIQRDLRKLQFWPSTELNPLATKLLALIQRRRRAPRSLCLCYSRRGTSEHRGEDPEVHEVTIRFSRVMEFSAMVTQLS